MIDTRTILVTGGLGGIGLGVACHLRELGARVVVSHRPGSAGTAAPPGCRAMPLDVTSEEDWERAIDAVVDECGALHGLVNVAGLLVPAIPFETLTLEEWRQHMAVNLDGSFLGCRTAMRAMALTGGGAIVNISSAAAHFTATDAAAYCVSKAAVLALTQVAAKAGAAAGVRVNAVLPGAIDTPMLWRNVRPGQDPQDLLGALVGMHPIGRIGTPLDVAHAVAFLLGRDSGFLTGAWLAVDGGQGVA